MITSQQNNKELEEDACASLHQLYVTECLNRSIAAAATSTSSISGTAITASN